jgi:hypothetical protein
MQTPSTPLNLYLRLLVRQLPLWTFSAVVILHMSFLRNRKRCRHSESSMAFKLKVLVSTFDRRSRSSMRSDSALCRQAIAKRRDSLATCLRFRLRCNLQSSVRAAVMQFSARLTVNSLILIFPKASKMVRLHTEGGTPAHRRGHACTPTRHGCIPTRAHLHTDGEWTTSRSISGGPFLAGMQSPWVVFRISECQIRRCIEFLKSQNCRSTESASPIRYLPKPTNRPALVCCDMNAVTFSDTDVSRWQCVNSANAPARVLPTPGRCTAPHAYLFHESRPGAATLSVEVKPQRSRPDPGVWSGRHPINAVLLRLL